MAWQLSGQMAESCSCKMLCPCIFGPAEPDQGWCSGALAWDIQQGNSDGVNLAGTTVALALDLPGDYVSGNGTGRIYIGDSANADQRRELEAIFTGQKGGAFSALSALLSKVLPVQTTSISITTGESPAVRVGSIGQILLQRVKTESGRQATVNDAPLLEVFGIASTDLARGDGSRWSDPDMRSWSSGGTGSIGRFSLKA